VTPLLSAAMIVRDEAEHLGDCLASLEGVADEVVVVDTGSSDGSAALAHSFGALVHHEEWTDDFSRARNAALDRASGRWILYIDADERLQPIAREYVSALLEAAEEVAFRLWLRPFAGATPCREYRVWRNDPRIRFEGIIHEKVVPAIKSVADSDGSPIGVCDLTLDHVGYDGDQTAKHFRNLPLLRAQLRAEPGNVFNWRHLASVLLALGKRDEGERALRRALALVQAAPGPDAGGAFVYADLVRLRYDQSDAMGLLDEGLSRYPCDPLLLWIKAMSELGRGDPDSALGWIDRLASVDPGRLDDTLAYDERLFGGLAHEARGLCLFRLGRFVDAAEAYRNAENCEPLVDEHRIKRLMAEHLSLGSSTARPR
jgi:tetratricopeptide (TPR) repeat protein